MYLYTFSKIQTPQDLNKITTTLIHEYRPRSYDQMLILCFSYVYFYSYTFILMYGSCHLDRALNVKYLLLLSLLTAAKFYHLGLIQGIIRVT